MYNYFIVFTFWAQLFFESMLVEVWVPYNSSTVYRMVLKHNVNSSVSTDCCSVINSSIV